MFKLLIAFIAGVATAKAIERIDLPREMRYLGWGGPYATDELDKQAEGPKAGF